METKKRLIFRLALACVAVLVASLALLAVAAAKDASARRDRAYGQQKVREAAVERSRKYLSEVARRVTKLPVDATVLGEIESRYFEEYPRGRMHVWAMSTTGELLFGVPREAFSKLNAIYDRDVLPQVKDGAFLDRQTFLRRLVDESEEIDDKAFAEEPPGTEPAERGGAPARDRAERAWQRWGRGGEDPDRAFVLSTPLKGADGQALGNLYLKTTVEREVERHDREEATAAIAMGAAGGAALALAGLWLLLPTWVFVDARSRGVRRAALYAFLTVLSAVIGLVVYLIARPEHPRTLPCPGCGKDVDGGAYCPHCGRDLSASFCASCRYPLKPDWAFCPACRTEIKPEPAAAPLPEAAG
jgi:hypothetical protein